MRKLESDLYLHIGEDKYPIYVVEDENGWDVECEHEVPLTARYDIIMETLKKYDIEVGE